MSDISSSPINTFTIGFDEKKYDESSLAERVAKKNNTSHHLLFLNWDKVEEDSNALLDNIDELFADPSLIATYEVSKMTREYVTVVLTGDSGDKLFTCYNKHLINYYGSRYKKIPYILRKGIIEPLTHFIPKDSILARKVKKTIQSADLDNVGTVRRLMSLGFREEEAKKILLDFTNESLDFLNAEFGELPDLDLQTKINI